MIEEALRRAGAAEDIDEMLAEFLVHYEANIAAESRPFPGAVASLEMLAASGARLAICTNKREYLTRKLLEALKPSALLPWYRRARHLRRVEAGPWSPHPGDRAGRRGAVPRHHGGRQRRRHPHGQRRKRAFDPGELRLCAGSAGRACSRRGDQTISTSLVPSAASILGASPGDTPAPLAAPTHATDLPNFDRTALNVEPQSKATFTRL